jgi:hypothetical protein
MITTRPSFAAFRGPVDREVFEFGVNPWRQASLALRRLWRAVVALPDRGDAATPDDVPPEYFRFPPF